MVAMALQAAKEIREIQVQKILNGLTSVREAEYRVSHVPTQIRWNKPLQERQIQMTCHISDQDPIYSDPQASIKSPLRSTPISAPITPIHKISAPIHSDLRSVHSDPQNLRSDPLRSPLRSLRSTPISAPITPIHISIALIHPDQAHLRSDPLRSLLRSLRSTPTSAPITPIHISIALIHSDQAHLRSDPLRSTSSDPHSDPHLPSSDPLMDLDLSTPEGVMANLSGCAGELMKCSSKVFGQIPKKIQEKRNALNSLTLQDKDGSLCTEINCLRREINDLLDDEEIYWGQRAKAH
ncbi:hypothetical protein SO802_006215 [Lithocarpus litseifolius]|uniref:Uncharacterized protein n=1 Tax=Lithocarpus litseifolius TaxID=425828 RepID=A0AAW2DK91_9ROSI